jgi:hypothetical protein
MNHNPETPTAEFDAEISNLFPGNHQPVLNAYCHDLVNRVHSVAQDELIHHRPENEQRRKDDPHLAVLNTILIEMGTLRKEVQTLAVLRPGLENHIAQEEEFQRKLLKIASEAFVDGDPVLHRLDHEARRDRARLCAKFWQGLLAKLGENTVFALLAVLAALIIYWVSGHIPKGAQGQ